MKRYLALGCLVLPMLIGCSPIYSDDFDGYVARSTSCDLVSPQSTDPHRHLTCAPGETCARGSADGVHSEDQAWCAPSRGDREVLSSCNDARECSAGMFCAHAAGCLRYCRLNESTCGASSTCLAFGDGPLVNGDDVVGYCALAKCDPLGVDCGGACWFYQLNRAGCFPRPGAKKQAASCAHDADCGRGLACGPQRVCTRYCRIEVGGGDCGGTRCIQTEGEDLSISGLRYGYCEQ